MKICLHNRQYNKKPPDNARPRISNEIANSTYNIVNLEETAYRIGQHGQTWCPATFHNSSRKADNFEQMQLFALDFDNTITYDEIEERATEYRLPILFAYETFSSVNRSKFRVVFLNDVPIVHRKVAEIMISALMTIFPECDLCCKDVSRMFFGGNNLFYLNKSYPTIDIHSLIMNLGLYFKNKYKETHYLAYFRKFASKFNLEYTTKGLIGIFEYDNENEIGKKSPNSIIYTNRIGENLHKFYVINFVDKDAPRAATGAKYTSSKNHKELRSKELKTLPEKCRLFKEFIIGEKWLYHNELVGLCTNLINVEGGEKFFLKALATHTNYESYQEKSWDYYSLYFKRKEYKPMCCDKFCPYCNECNHGHNMLSTIKLKYRTIERLSNSNENYCSVDEAHEDVRNKFLDITKKDDKKIHVIYAQTAIGKTHIYVDYLKTAKKPCLICVPTNILKNEVYHRAKDLDINIMKTPSISELTLPKKIKKHIDKLYETGQYNKVHPYIKSVLQKEDIPELQEYLDELSELREFKGHMVTTHKRLLNLSRKHLENYEIIVDEDILTTMVKNQNEISLESLEECYKTIDLDPKYRAKIEEVLYKAKNEEFFSAEKLKFEYGKNADAKIDLPSFFKAEKYYSDGKRILYLANPKLKKVKYIILSATATKQMYETYFGEDRVCFYNCKEARYMGNLKQYYNHSFSRAFIKDNDGIYDKIEDFLGAKLPTLTYKGYKDGCILHFGNTEGCDCLAGEDIAVIGTPHVPDFIYKLLAYQMGYTCDDILKNQVVPHNNCRFWFMTYEDELLRNIQFWIIESELVQCVGRARLLRYDCNVSLFSNFPLPQAELLELEF